MLPNPPPVRCDTSARRPLALLSRFEDSPRGAAPPPSAILEPGKRRAGVPARFPG